MELLCNYIRTVAMSLLDDSPTQMFSQIRPLIIAAHFSSLPQRIKNYIWKNPPAEVCGDTNETGCEAVRLGVELFNQHPLNHNAKHQSARVISHIFKDVNLHS